jgi:hypothetical protein
MSTMKPMKAFKVPALLAALGALALPLATSKDAVACGGAYIPYVEIDYRPQGVAQAEKFIQEGKYLAAAGNVIRMMPHIKDIKVKNSTGIAGRAQHVLALAIARSGGNLDIADQLPDYIQDGWLGADAEERTTNLEYSISVLRKMNSIKSDAKVESELAEALAQVDSHKKEAREILERLAKKDLVPSAEAYAALAKLRGQDGDKQGEKVAIEHCSKMTKTPGMCGGSSSGSAQS